MLVPHVVGVAATLLVAGVVAAACQATVPAGSAGPAGLIACVDGSECPLSDNACLLAMCLDGVCVHTPAPDGPLPPDTQVLGDCKHLYCDGDGNIAAFASGVDLPPEDGNACTESACDVMNPVQQPREAGAACNDEGGICNGTGICGVCVPKVKRCDGNAVAVCDARGQWNTPEVCPVTRPVCSAERCLGPLELAAGRAHACTRLEGGTLWCWGSRDAGQVGDAGLAGSRTPFWAAGFVKTAFGPRHACGVKSDGSVYCWGANDFGQLGDGTYVSTNGPTAATVSGVRSLAVGHDHTCALLVGGELRCWGRNDHGQLGAGALAAGPAEPLAREHAPGAGPTSPTPIGDVIDTTNLVAAEAHSCANLPAGTMRCWGRWSYPLPDSIEPPGADGDEPAGAPPAGTVDPVKERDKVASRTPVAVAGLTAIKDIYTGAHHACALRSDDTVVCWGANDKGQLGDGTTSDAPRARPVRDVANVRRVEMGDDFACALLRTAEVRCWGANDEGQLGTGAAAPYAAAATIAALDPVMTLRAGGAFACALTKQARIFCWGDNSAGQLGAATTEDARLPVAVKW